MIVVPDNDAQLSEPAFNPPSGVQVRLPKAQFDQSDPEQFVARVSTAAKLSLKAQRSPRPATARRLAKPLTAAEVEKFERIKAGGRWGGCSG